MPELATLTVTLQQCYEALTHSSATKLNKTLNYSLKKHSETTIFIRVSIKKPGLVSKTSVGITYKHKYIQTYITHT